MTDTSARTVVLKPGDVLLVGNVGAMGEEAADALHEGLTQLRFALGLSSVAVFEQGIEAAALAPVVPMPDAVVLRLFGREALAEQREALAAWLKANGIDPDAVAADWLSIERAADQRLIRYEAFRLTKDGRRLRDPRDGDRAWTVERVAPLVVDLDLPAAIGRYTE
ncbi:hypothetical protein [Streptomyces sp. AK08-02]|uniref:hypothetical protein n=1 Tax=Streptomyces sp. AK08-02 TaxID=3028654 RepID=UPI0029BD64AC|nr:hypothetical protein [Streptomyces sp. AK08-02]MDX3747464.1 hypothetical protein [Streptomyces sp. AK08-02]